MSLHSRTLYISHELECGVAPDFTLTGCVSGPVPALYPSLSALTGPAGLPDEVGSKGLPALHLEARMLGLRGFLPLCHTCHPSPSPLQESSDGLHRKSTLDGSPSTYQQFYKGPGEIT